MTDIAGQSPVEVFEAGDARLLADLRRSTRTWIAYDPTLGPQLREVPALVDRVLRLRHHASPPFDDVRVRQAFAMAVDWRRIAAPRRRPTGDAPRVDLDGAAGHPRRSDADFLPIHDPDAARAAARRGRLSGRRGLPADHDA